MVSRQLLFDYFCKPINTLMHNTLTDCKKEVLDHPDYNNMMMTFPETSRGTLAYTIEECPLNTVNGKQTVKPISKLSS